MHSVEEIDRDPLLIALIGHLGIVIISGSQNVLFLVCIVYLHIISLNQRT